MPEAEHASLGIDIGGTSVKAALVRAGVVERVGRSSPYARPSAAELQQAVQEALREIDTASARTCGLCLPGVYDPASASITASANVPALVGVKVRDLLPWTGDATVLSDALAAGLDYWSLHKEALPGRLLAISLGTGVGAVVLDRGQPLRVNGTSPGHFGQLDVTLSEDDPDTPIGPDGGRGSLEGYLGLPALRARYGERLLKPGWTLTASDPPLRALARALRLAHALYRPEHIVFLGGVGLRLGASLPALRQLVDDRLTSLARPGWTLGFGTHEWHAASGAARWAAGSSRA